MMFLMSSPLSLILTLTLVRPESFHFLLTLPKEAYKDCFHVFLSLCIFFPPASHVEGSSLTTYLRYQDALSVSHGLTLALHRLPASADRPRCNVNIGAVQAHDRGYMSPEHITDLTARI